jgi:type I restriction enzyme S subunit
MIGARIDNRERLPREWSVRTVGELGKYLNGYPFKPSEWTDEGLPIIRIQNLTDFKKPFNYFAGEAPNRYLIESGDILVSWSASLGTFRWSGGRAWLNQHIFKATPNPTVTHDGFFYYLMRHAIERIAKNARGSTMRHVTLKEFVQSEVALPPLDEQRRIAALLSAVQKAIDQQERLVALTAELKNALMQKLFTEGARGEPLKQTAIGPVPQSWIVDRLDSFCLLQRGFDITKEEQSDGPVPVISSGGIKSHHNVARVAGPGVVVGRKGTLGTVHYVEGPYWPHDTTLWVKNFRGNDPRFTAYFLDRLDFARFDSGASNPTLNRNTVHAETVAYPPLEQQKEIAAALSVIERKSEAHERYVASLRSLFRTLLHQIMSAHIRVCDLDLSALEKGEQKPVGVV